MLVVEAKRGRFIISPNDVYLGRSLRELGEFAEGQVDLFAQVIQKDWIVVDAGANIGAHTVVFGQLANTVHAFEPQRAAFHMLCGNVALNDLHNVQCHRVALGEKRERVGIPVLDYGRKNNLGALAIGSGGMELDTVEVVPLDVRCHFLKIDVEGYEIKVLQGAEPMIREVRPLIYVENDRPDMADALIATLRDLEYTPYWHVTPLYRKDNHRGAADPFNGLASIDMFCAPPGLQISGLEEARAGDFEKKFRMAKSWEEAA